jgi:carboxyl-terminal processing protease
MPFPECRLPRLARPLVATLCAALLAACGGGGDDTGGNPPPTSCSVDEQKATLRTYFDDWYFWYALAPNPSPAAYASVADYFDALLYTGVDPAFPKDRWSNFESTESFNRFFGDGKSLGYGVSVAGLEVTGLPDQPLYVRYIEPLSPAATAGVVRGDQVLSINGRSAAEVITADDFSALTADSAGQTLTLALRNAGGDRTLTLTAAVFTLTPVSRASVVTTPLGRKLGYVVMKDMISQSLTPLDNAFADFRAQGVSDVVLDLRYNGGGLVSVASSVAAHVGGGGASGKTFATLLYNDKRASNNATFRFANPASALGVSRVYVLTGRRTCSASEQVINGLRGVGIDVISIGETTCGKPVGFLPTDLNQCGTTYSVVNFESVNARNEGRYFDGFGATCAVAEDWSKPLGANDEPLLATARTLADGGACPVAAARERPMSQRKATPRAEPGERQAMIPR